MSTPEGRGGGGGGGRAPSQVREGGVAKGRDDQLAEQQAEQFRQASLPASRVGGGGGAALNGDAIQQVFAVAHPFNDAALNTSFASFRDVNMRCQELIHGGPGLLEETRTTLLTQAFPQDIRILARDVVSDIFRCLTEEIQGSISQDQIDLVNDCIFAELMKGVPVTSVIGSIGNLFLSLYYRNNPLRIGVAVAHGAATSYAAWISGLDRVAGLSVEGAGLFLSGLAAGYSGLVAPGVAAAPQEPPFQGPLNFNQSRADLHWDNIPAADRGIFEELRQDLGALAGDPMNQAMFLAELSRRLIDRCVPVGPAFRRLDRFLIDDAPQGVAETVFQRIKREGGNLMNHLLNYLLGLLDMLRKLPAQGVGMVGSPDNSYRNQLIGQFTLLIGGMYRSFRAQGLLSGLDDNQINELFVKELLNLLLPLGFRDAARLGFNHSAREEIIYLVGKIKSGVVECCRQGRMVRGGVHVSVNEDMLGRICPYFSSQLTQERLEVFQHTDLMNLLNKLKKSARQAEGMGSGSWGSDVGNFDEPSSPLHVRLAAVHNDFFRLLSLGMIPFATPEERTIMNLLLNDERFLAWCAANPDRTFRYIKDLVMSRMSGSGVRLHNEIKAFLEEPARVQPLITHQFPPDARVFLVHIMGVLELMEAVVAQDLTHDETLAEITRQMEAKQYGEMSDVLRFVESILRMSIAWSLKTNTKLFTLAIKTRHDGEQYPILIVNLDSMPGWTVEAGRPRQVRLPLELVKDSASVFLNSAVGAVGGLLGRAGSAVGGFFSGQNRPIMPNQGSECPDPASLSFSVAQGEQLRMPPQRLPPPLLVQDEAASLEGVLARIPMTSQNLTTLTTMANASEEKTNASLAEDLAGEIAIEQIGQDAAATVAALGSGAAALGGGEAALGVQQTVFPVLPLLDTSSMGQSSVLLDLGSMGGRGGDMGSGHVDVVKVVNLENKAAKHLVDAAHLEDAAARRLENVSKELIDKAKRFAHPPATTSAVLNLPLSEGAAAAASEIPETPNEQTKRKKINKGLQRRNTADAAGMNGGRKSRKTTKRTRRNKGRKSSSKTSKKTRQRRGRRSSRHRRSSRKGRK